MAQLAKMLSKHPSAELALESSVVAVSTSMFKMPPDEGQSVSELVDEVSPGYLRACLEMANRAMSGNVNPFKEGDLPHKMALLLAHRMTPSRKWSDRLPDESPEKVKKTARALKSIIKSLTEDGEIIVDSTVGGMDSHGHRGARSSDGGQGQDNDSK